MHYRFLLPALLMQLASLSLYAIPAKPVRRALTLQDGSRVEATLRGDEHLHYYRTDDGRTLQLAPECIALPESDEVYNVVDGDMLRTSWKDRLMRSNARRTKRAVRRKVWGDESNPIIGSRRGLVILVNFSDRKMVHTQEIYDRFFNMAGYSEYGMEGSVHDYFLSQSYGQFDLTFDVVGPVTLEKPLAYYGQNTTEGDDKHAGEMVAEACKLVDEKIDFSDYDWDGDGMVDQVFVIYAGYGESQSGSKSQIWPHEFTLTECKLYLNDGPGALSLDGVLVDTYACSCELSGSRGTQIDGIGSACHEFSHCLFLPDMYDTEGSSFGMGYWDLMDMGCYNADSKCPCSFTSYERMYCGWLKPVVLSSSCQVKDMQPITSAPEAYIIYNSAYPKEYYLLENHQLEGWDKGAMGHGMLILHVDFESIYWQNNVVNVMANHQRMTIIPADNNLRNSVFSYEGDPWPGKLDRHELSATTTPAATLYNTNSLGEYTMEYALHDIAETDGLISFSFEAPANAVEAIQGPTYAQTPVYDLSGRIVLPAGRWKSGSLSKYLTPGIYLIDGRKVQVR